MRQGDTGRAQGWHGLIQPQLAYQSTRATAWIATAKSHYAQDQPDVCRRTLSVHCQEMMQASERADLAIQHLRDNPSGRLRITSPADFGATLLASLTTEFQRRFPAVSLEMAISDTLVD